MISAAMAGWLGTLTALPMSWHSEAITTSSSAPARSARVAVCSECTSWFVLKPSVMSSSDRSMPRTRSATLDWFFADSSPITAHCSALDSSMRVNVVATRYASSVDDPNTLVGLVEQLLQFLLDLLGKSVHDPPRRPALLWRPFRVDGFADHEMDVE